MLVGSPAWVAWPGVHALVAMCVVVDPDDSSCDAPLSSIQFTVSDPISLDDEVRPLAYRFGEVLGTLLFVGVPLWIFFAIRRRSRARAAVKAAARPGSPPGPGGAAGGR